MGDRMFDLSKINDCLNTKVTGRTIIQYDTLNSTYLKSKNIFGTCPDGAVILTENQTKWNVRMGKEWICCPDKNIYLSIILKPKANNHLISIYDVIGCSSIFSALKTMYGTEQIECKIKWPNDIIINGKKVSSVGSSLVNKNKKDIGVIISIGINVNMRKEELESTEEIKDGATSLLVETFQEADREKLIAEILNNVEEYYSEMISGKSALSAVNIFNENSEINHKDIEIIKKGKKSKNTVHVQGIDSEGGLVVINDRGNEEILIAGETTCLK